MALLDLVLPTACGGCGRHGGLLCTTCRGQLRPATDDADLFIAPLPGVIVGEALTLGMAAFLFEGPIQRALIGSSTSALPAWPRRSPTPRCLRWIGCSV